MSRSSHQSRATAETTIELDLEIDGSGTAKASTGIPFFDHMLEQLGKHGGFDLRVEAKGDLDVDLHHTVEDVGIALEESRKMGLKMPGLEMAEQLYKMAAADGLAGKRTLSHAREQATEGWALTESGRAPRREIARGVFAVSGSAVKVWAAVGKRSGSLKCRLG